MNMSPHMHAALDAIHKAELPVFPSLLWNEEKRFIFPIHGNTIRALLARGMIVEDHRVVHPQPWVIDTVYYRLVEQEDGAA